MMELRSLPPAGYIGSVHEGPVTDLILVAYNFQRSVMIRFVREF
jgi:hypothetical protein